MMSLWQSFTFIVDRNESITLETEMKSKQNNITQTHVSWWTSKNVNKTKLIVHHL